MRVNPERYQHGSIRKVPRAQGFAWEFRFYITAPDGKRKLKVQRFDSAKYPAERDVRKAVEGQLSALLHYKLEGFSAERLMHFLGALGQDMEIVVKSKPRSRSVRIVVKAA
jgi:hypothetical protein